MTSRLRGAAVATVIVLYVTWAIANIGLHYQVVQALCDMGTDKTLIEFKQVFGQESVTGTRGLTTLGDEELEYLLECASGGAMATDWRVVFERSGIDIRQAMLKHLRDTYGLFLSGPFKVEGEGRWVLTVFYTTSTSIKGGELDWFDLPLPAFGVTIESAASVFGASYLKYTPFVKLTAQQEFAIGATEYLFYRAAWVGLPNQPIAIYQDPSEAGERLAEMRANLGEFSTLIGSVRADWKDMLVSLNREREARLARFLSAVFELLIADRGTVFEIPSNRVDRTGEEIRYGSELQQELTSRLLWVRLLNGTNRLSGLINVAIAGVLVFAMCVVVSARGRSDSAQSVRLAQALVVLLPMLGFFGTLYGMLLGLSGIRAGDDGSRLMSYIGISLDTTILAIASTIVLSLILMFIRKRSCREQ